MSFTCLGLGYDARMYRELPQPTEDEHPLSTIALIIYSLLTFLT